MKKLILLSLIIMPFINVLTAQTITDQIDNFTVEDKKVVWQKVFETDLSFNELTDKFKESGILENMDISHNKVIGKTKLIKLLHNEAGFTNMGTPWYVVGYFIQPIAKIEFKDGRYRVTLTNMSLQLNQTSPVAGISEKDVIESFVLNRDKFKSQFTKKTSKIYDFTFNKEFDFKKSQNIADDEW